MQLGSMKRGMGFDYFIYLCVIILIGILLFAIIKKVFGIEY